jgi:UDP-glucose 4-epimerase
MTPNILVIGGTGFIGSHLVEALTRGEGEVTVLTRDLTTARCNLRSVQQRVKIVEGTLAPGRPLEVLKRNRFDTIFYLAGSPSVGNSIDDPKMDYVQNLGSTFTLLENLRSSYSDTKLIFCSSAAVYGNPAEIPIKETTATIPISPYGVSKLAAERYIAVYCQLYGMRAASLRLFSVYGPRQTKLVIYDFIKQLVADPTHLQIRGDGRQARDFIYVDDVVKAILLVANRGALTGETYNVASGKSISIATLARKLSSTLGISPQLIFTGKQDSGHPDKWFVEIERLSALGFLPTTSLETGLRRTCHWFKAQNEPYQVAEAISALPVPAI